jgi:hypothetical protein
MIVRWILVLVKWTVALGLIAGCLYGAYSVKGRMQAERAREGDEDRIQAPRRMKGSAVVLGAEDANRLGLKEEPARSISWSRRVPVYGQVVPNPSAAVEVRSPFAGTLRAGPNSSWPAPGQWVRAGRALGWIDIRIDTQERLALQDNLNNAYLKKQGAEKVVQLQRERVRRVEKVSLSQIVPGQNLDDAKVLLADAETQLAIATAAVQLWRKALEEADRPGDRETSTFSQPLLAPADGEVTELAARPGMAIEAGALVAQLIDFRRALARLDMPAELLASGPPPRVRLTALSASPGAGALSGLADRSNAAEPVPQIEAVLVGAAPRVDPVSQHAGYWYATEPDRSEGTAEEPGPGTGHGGGAVWRPGLLVTALVSLAGAPAMQAVAVPAEAVLFHQGRSLVYVREGPRIYERREARLLGREGNAWVLAPRQGNGLTGIASGEIIVSAGAQVLLSEEFRGDVDAD